MMANLKLQTLADCGRQQADKTYCFSRAPHLGGNLQGGDDATFYPELWQWVVKRYRVQTVMDVGCAEGFHTKYFEQLGCRIVGVEGLLPNAIHPDSLFPIIINDFRKSYVQVAKVDLAWCCEVLEHIEEEFLDKVMQTLLNGRYIAITHALPGQGGHHHVNEQPPGYWIEQFARYDCEWLEEDSIWSRKLAHGWYRRTGMIFWNHNWNAINGLKRLQDIELDEDSNILGTVLQRLNAKLEAWIRSDTPIVVFGAGKHTDFLARHTPLVQANLVAFADRSHCDLPEKFGRPVVPPEAIGTLQPEIVVISSIEFQDEMYNAIAALEKEGIVIERLYAPHERLSAARELHGWGNRQTGDG
ncbi:MAG: methyltransferase domain-containing protein [Desulfobacterales bacterium]|nr:MAG: methyltransferase domain-containing protein [Desulfobacterales bacterium]